MKGFSKDFGYDYGTAISHLIIRQIIRKYYPSCLENHMYIPYAKYMMNLKSLKKLEKRLISLQLCSFFKIKIAIIQI